MCVCFIFLFFSFGGRGEVVCWLHFFCSVSFVLSCLCCILFLFSNLLFIVVDVPSFMSVCQHDFYSVLLTEKRKQCHVSHKQ